MIGTPRVHLRLTDSTNERAKELAAAGAPHGTLVTADEQSAGRGRQGRVWTAPAGSAVLMAAFVVAESRNPQPMLDLTLFRKAPFVGAGLAPVVGRLFDDRTRGVPHGVVDLVGVAPGEAGRRHHRGLRVAVAVALAELVAQPGHTLAK